jgi:hypothetical protein
MTTDRLSRAAQAFLPAPIKAAIELLRDSIGPPNLEKVATEMLQEDVVRLHRQMVQLNHRLTDEVRVKMDPIETLELVTQTLTNMARTASRDKRRAMSNVLVNGLDRVDVSALERRLFVRATADLDMAHIDLLRRYEQAQQNLETLILSEHEQALAHELAGRSLLVRVESAAYGGALVLAYEGVTDLGRRFLEHLREPPEV